MYRFTGLQLCLVCVLNASTALSAPPEDAIRERAKARLTIARQGLAEAEKVIEGVTEDYANIWLWSNRVLRSELAVSSTKKARVAALESHLRRVMKLEKIAQREYNQGRFSRVQLLEALYRRADVECRLTEEKAKPETPPKRPGT